MFEVRRGRGLKTFAMIFIYISHHKKVHYHMDEYPLDEEASHSVVIFPRVCVWGNYSILLHKICSKPSILFSLSFLLVFFLSP